MIASICAGGCTTKAYHAVSAHLSAEFTNYTTEFSRKAGLDHLNSSHFARPQTFSFEKPENHRIDTFLVSRLLQY